MMKICFLVLLPLLFIGVYGDTPANCHYDQIIGNWEFFITDPKYDRTTDCPSFHDFLQHQFVNLYYPNTGNINTISGTWTMIYNQGFEFRTADGWKYFNFFKYEMLPNGTAVSYCHETFSGWYHNDDKTKWGCWRAAKMTKSEEERNAGITLDPPPRNRDLDWSFPGIFPSEIEKINQEGQWKASSPLWTRLTWEDRIRLGGGKLRTGTPPLKSMNPSLKYIHSSPATNLPDTFDWRNKDGKNYVVDVRNQLQCGSCYSFSTTDATASRIRIRSKLEFMALLSPQQVVDCSNYSQGCDGGFAYLVSKFGQDYGFVEESCYPYEGVTNPQCSECSTPHRYYVEDYNYVGNYYGNVTELGMMEELYNRGPIAVDIEVYDDFFHYSGGIYEHKDSSFSFDPFELTNHSVLLVGWGVENGVKYWIVQNSWGTDWGENGYFRIVRGIDNCAIESQAIWMTPLNYSK